jgi:hypothetical protein
MTKLASSSETAIALCFLVMHLEKWLAAISLLCLYVKDQKLRLQDNWDSRWLLALYLRQAFIP